MATDEQTLRLNILADNRAGPAMAEVVRQLQLVNRALKEQSDAAEKARQAMAHHHQMMKDAAEAARRQRDAVAAATRAARENAAAVEFQRQAIQRLMRTMQGGLQGVLTVGSSVRGMLGSLMPLFHSLFGRLIDLLRRLLSVIGQVVSAIAGALARAIESVLGVSARTAAVGVASLAAAMTLFAKRGVDVNTTLDRMSIGFTRFLGSSGRAQQFIEGIRKEAELSGTSFLQIAQQQLRLLGGGFTQREAGPYSRILRDLTIGTGGTQENLERIVYALRQWKAKGVLRAEEAELQFAEAGVPMRRLLGVQEGETWEDLAKARDPRVMARTGIPRFMAAAQQEFGGLDVLIADRTLTGRLNNIGDALDRISSIVTKGLTQGLWQAAGALRDFLMHMEHTAWGQVILANLQRAFDAIGKLIANMAAKLPELGQRLAAFLQSERWERFKQAASAAWDLLRGAAQRAIEWIGEHWPRVWDVIKRTALAGARIVFQVFGGIAAAWKALTGQFATGAMGWQEVLIRVGVMLHEWAVLAVRAFFGVAHAVLNLVDKWGALWALMSARNPFDLSMKMIAMAAYRWQYFEMKRDLRETEVKVLEKIGLPGPRGEGFDVRKKVEEIFAGMGGFEKRGGLPGAFRSGVEGGGAAFDELARRLEQPGRPPAAAAPVAPKPAAARPRDFRAEQAAHDRAASQTTFAGGGPVARPRRPAAPSIEVLGAQVKYWQAAVAAAANPQAAGYLTERGLIPALMRHRGAILGALPTEPEERWKALAESQQILADVRSARESYQRDVRRAAPSAAAAPGGGHGGHGGHGGAARPRGLGGFFGLPEAPTGAGVRAPTGGMAAPAMAAAGAGTTQLVFNLPMANPDYVAGIVRRVLVQLTHQSYGR